MLTVYISACTGAYRVKEREKSSRPELLAPAGDRAALTAAVKAGADAVYFGTDCFNMRRRAGNFRAGGLAEAAAFCRDAGVSTHLALNTIVYEDELYRIEEMLDTAATAGIDMIICADPAIIAACREKGMPFCVSTQASVSNSAAAAFYQRLGARRVVLARECTLDMIREIRRNTDIELETFVHGAMCIAVSGRCFLSHYRYGKSANRGECNQPCRREFFIRDNDDEEQSLVIGEDYVLSPKDLCTIEFVDRLIAAGINAFKIEGRMRNADYVHVVVSAYRRAIDACFDGTYNTAMAAALKREMTNVFNRGFSSGFYFGAPGENDFARQYGSQAATQRDYAGKVLNYYRKAKAVYIRIEGCCIRTGDTIRITGPATGVAECVVTSIMREGASIEGARKGMAVTLAFPDRVRENDQVYRIRERDISPPPLSPPQDTA
jgi:U32 family peptidase